MERCDDCGEALLSAIGLEKHRERCTGLTADAVAGSFGDGSCPMCGEPYDRYLQHLASCDAAAATGSTAATTNSEEPTAGPAPTEAARHETDQLTWQ